MVLCCGGSPRGRTDVGPNSLCDECASSILQAVEEEGVVCFRQKGSGSYVNFIGHLSKPFARYIWLRESFSLRQRALFSIQEQFQQT